MSLTKKEKRAFQRLVSGLTIGCNLGAYYRFLTLTTSDQAVSGGHYVRVKTSSGWFYIPKKHDINEDFDTLKKRIARATAKKDNFKGFKFNRYFKLKTSEGNGVLHIVYWGGYIPHDWLSRVWKALHGSPVVDIRSCVGGKGTNVKGLVGYLLTNYLTKQPIERMSYGWKWAWLGLAKSWSNVKKTQSNLHKCQIKDFGIKKFTSFKSRWRNASLEYWKSLLHHPKASSRQTKFTNPKHTRINYFGKKHLIQWIGTLTPVEIPLSVKEKELSKWRSYWVDHVELVKPVVVVVPFIKPKYDFGSEGLNRFWN